MSSRESLLLARTSPRIEAEARPAHCSTGEGGFSISQGLARRSRFGPRQGVTQKSPGSSVGRAAD
jgi:hypothetical protein